MRGPAGKNRSLTDEAKADTTTIDHPANVAPDSVVPLREVAGRG
jgi:hypothetical protein